MIKLKECPFCGSNDLYFCSSSRSGFISCNGCEMDGPPARGVNEYDPEDILKLAKELWNKRKR